MVTDSPGRPGRVVHARPPLDEEFVRSLHCGDEVWLDGTVWGVRDASLIRFFDEGERVDVDFDGAVFLHTAPSVRSDGAGRYLPVSVGTTTSMRMDRFTRGCLEELGVRAIIGKGGLSAQSMEHLRRHGGVYLAITGGAASMETEQVDEIEDVLWEDLMPECLWRFRVRGLGPLFVGMDSHGVSDYQAVSDRAQERRAEARRILGL